MDGTPGSESRGVTHEQLTQLVHDHGADVYRVAVAIVHDHNLAEDVVQDVLLRVWKSMPEDAIEIPTGWLRVVTRNAAIDLLRLRRFSDVTELSEEPEAVSARPDRIVEGRHQLDAVWNALSTLDADSRAMLVLRESEEMNYRELADMFELTVPAVKTKLYRARHALRQQVRDWES